jgi:hypothetical protein
MTHKMLKPTKLPLPIATMSLSCSRFAGVVWVVLTVALAAVQSCSALDQPRSFLPHPNEPGAALVEPIGVERSGIRQLIETTATTSESKGQEPAMDNNILPQLMESIGAAVNTLVSDGFVKTTAALRGDSRRHELQTGDDLDNAHRLLQSGGGGGGGLIAQIGALIIPIVVAAVAQIIISTLGIGGLAGQLTSAIVLAVSGVISAAILSILFGGGLKLKDFVTTTFKQKLPTSPNVNRRKFKLFPIKSKLPVIGSMESRKFAQLLSNAMDSVTMPGLPKLKLPLEDSVASVQLLSTTMNNWNLTLDVSTVNATALGETMLAIIAGLPLEAN